MSESNIPPVVAKKLRAIRRRAIAIHFLRGVMLTAAVLFTVMLLAMALDWLVGWFDHRARYAVTITALSAALAAFIAWCVRPLLSPHTIVATAREVDESLPQLEERWSTVTELSESKDAPEIRGSEAMIRKVSQEAESVGSSITPEGVISASPAVRASFWAAGAVAMLLLLLAVNFGQASRLVARFWMPGRDISLTSIAAKPGDTWVARGEPLTLQATLKGRMPENGAKLFLRPEEGAVQQLAMNAQTGTPGSFQHAISEVAQSFEYRVRAGDGQTPWHRISAVDRPRISEVRMKVTPPAYSKLPVDEKASLPNAVRVLQGSDVEVSFRADQAVERLLIDLGNGQSIPLQAGNDNWYTYRTRPTNSFTFAAAAINQYKLENRNKPSCRISVYEDLAPSVKILEPSDNLAVLPGEKVNVTFEAADDFGLARAEIRVETLTADGQTNSVKMEVPLAADEGKKQFRKSVQLDPKALGLKHGDQLSYVVQVTDTKQAPAEAAASSGEADRTSEPNASQSQQAQSSNQSSTPSDLAKNSNEQQQNNASESQQQSQNDSNQSQQPQTSSQSQNQSSLAANAKPQPPRENQPAGSQPPENDMAKRMLDVGQTSQCKPRNILVDEWAGSFEGEKRKKLEIAIEPVLEQLKQLLTSAGEKTATLKEPAESADGLQLANGIALSSARGNLAEAERAAGSLKARTANTPYAFIGLQLYNIKDAHIAPAGGALAAVTIPGSSNAAHVATASFHILRALTMLDDLTRTFNTVKRDQKIADAMQKLNKMYQIFLEDTQAMLGASKGAINSYDREIAEVDDAYVEKLKDLLEQKKKIMAELAALLAEDPRLLRRYMAMMELQGTTLRDQMTLLAERQKEIQQQVAKWNSTLEAERPALARQIQKVHAANQRDMVRDAAKLRENMETWLPLDMKPDDPAIKPALDRAEKISILTGEYAVASGTPTNHAQAASKLTAELNALREEITKLEPRTTDHPKLRPYIANRLEEIESLRTAEAGATRVTDALARDDFAKAAEVVQDRITQDTVKLSHKLEATEAQVARMSPEIAETAARLMKIVKAQIIWSQLSTVVQLEARDLPGAAESQTNTVASFARAEEAFDEMMNKIIAKLDEEPPPDSVGEAPGAEDILAMLEDEMKAAEELGIPPRPLNINIQRDWMRPGQASAQGQGKSAQQQAQQAREQAQRLEQQARQSAREALAAARQQGVAKGSEPAVRSDNWNKLASRLQKDLLQGRDNTPPEQYRAAIENYFRILSETTRNGEPAAPAPGP